MHKELSKERITMKNNLKEKYEELSGNIVIGIEIIDSSGNFVDYYSDELALNYIQLVKNN